jgi:branched-chain amino acid transport system permease protein
VSAFRVVRTTTASRIFIGVSLVAVVLLATLPEWGSAANQLKLVELLVLIALAQMWNLLAGYAGVVSVGQQAFVGLGAYGMIELVNNQGLGLWWSIPIAAVAAALISVPMGLIAFQLRGAYFAIGTWVLAEVVSKLMVNISRVGGGSGASIDVAGTDPADRLKYTYWFALAIGVGAIVAAYVVLRSRWGLAMQAIRDNEAGARGLGIDVYRTRFAIWVLAAFITALAGATFYLSQLRVQPTSSFSVVQWTAPIIFIVVIGGFGTLEGPIIGAVLYWWFKNQFIDHDTWYSTSIGLIAIVVALYLQKGIWGIVRERFGTSLLSVGRRLHLTTSPATQNGVSDPGP